MFFATPAIVCFFFWTADAFASSKIVNYKIFHAVFCLNLKACYVATHSMCILQHIAADLLL